MGYYFIIPSLKNVDMNDNIQPLLKKIIINYYQ